MTKYVMALDAGTTSNRCILFDHQGRIASLAQKEFQQYFPSPDGWNMTVRRSGRPNWEWPWRP